MNVYDEDIIAAQQAIEEYGRDIILSISRGSYNKATDTYTDGTAEISLKAVATSFKSRDIDGTNVKRGDKTYLVPAASLQLMPQTTDRIIDGNETFAIVDVDVVSPGSQAILYKIQARK